MNQHDEAWNIVFEAVCELQKMACHETGEVQKWLDDLSIALFNAFYEIAP